MGMTNETFVNLESRQFVHSVMLRSFVRLGGAHSSFPLWVAHASCVAKEVGVAAGPFGAIR